MDEPDSMFNQLLELPLFKGVTYSRLAEVVESSRFSFAKHKPGETLMRSGQTCQSVMFVINGSVQLVVENRSKRLRLEQWLDSPDVIFPDFLFGRRTCYPATGIAGPQGCGTIEIAKADYINILNSDPVFLFNYLNLLARNAQKAVDGVLALAGGSLEERIALWIVALTQPSGRDISLECRHRDLYTLFGVTRSVFYQTLDSLQARGIITHSANRIGVIDRRKLVEILDSRI